MHYEAEVCMLMFSLPLNSSKTIHVSKEANDGDNQTEAEAEQLTETIKQSSLKSIHDVLQH